MRVRVLKDLLVVLLQKEIKVRYKTTWLGYLWSIANPLAFALVYFIAFGIMMHVQIPRYPLFLLAGLFPWQWLANSINASSGIFLWNASLLKKVRFPSSALVVTTVLNDAFHFLFSLPVIMAAGLWYGVAPTWTWAAGIPILMVEQFLLIYGFALTIASVNLFFRDLERMVSLTMVFLFFLTPIVYSASMIPSAYSTLTHMNPVAPLMLSWQQLFIEGSLNWTLISWGYVYGFMSLGLGLLVHQKLSLRFAEVA